jgi:hypothetical protein
MAPISISNDEVSITLSFRKPSIVKRAPIQCTSRSGHPLEIVSQQGKKIKISQTKGNINNPQLNLRTGKNSK